MELTLSSHEAHLLQESLESYLNELTAEIGATDSPEYRDQLRIERQVLESIHSRLLTNNSAKAMNDSSEIRP